MKGLIFLAVLAVWSPCVEVSASLEVHYLRTVNMNDTSDLYNYNLKEVEKLNETAFRIFADGELFVPIDNAWHMSVQVFRSEEGKEEFGEKPFISIQKKKICDFMKTSYKDRLYPLLEGCSNLPNPDECPVKPGKFWIKGCLFNGQKYVAMGKPGMYRLDLFVSQDHEESHITKMGISVYVSVTQTE